MSTLPAKRKKHAVIRWAQALLITVLLMLAIVIGVIFFWQHSLIYHPRPYDSTYAHALPPDGVMIEYRQRGGKQVAYYVPGSDPIPRRLWIAFCGNGSLALDWTTILQGYPRNGD